MTFKNTGEFTDAATPLSGQEIEVALKIGLSEKPVNITFVVRLLSLPT